MPHPTPVPRLIPVRGSFLGPLVVGLLASCLCGCGIHHYDAKTGVEHLWGFGHLRMRVHPPTNGVQAVITGNQLVGVRVGAGFHLEQKALASQNNHPGLNRLLGGFR